MIEKPQIVTTEDMRFAYIRITVPRYEIQTIMEPGFSELMESLEIQGVKPAGSWFNHHLKMDPEIFDFRHSIPIQDSIQEVDRLQSGVLEASTVARTVYHGP